MARGDRIKELRLMHGLTLEELGAKIGTGKATIKKYESGVIENIPSDKIEALANALETAPEYLMGWDSKKQSDDSADMTIHVKHSETRILAQGFDKLPEDARKKALEMMDFFFDKYFDNEKDGDSVDT